jgi:flagellar protein FliL
MPQAEQQVTGVEEAQAEAQNVEVDKVKKGLKFNLIVIVATQIVLAGVGYFVVGKYFKSDPSFRQVIAEQQNAPEKAEPAKEETKKQIFPIEDIIVNPAGTAGSRYLSASIGVEMDVAEEKGGGKEGEGEAKTTPLDEKKLQLRDALINILSSKTIEQLTTPEQKEAIRKEILDTFKNILTPKQVYQIYFIDFVLQ